MLRILLIIESFPWFNPLGINFTGADGLATFSVVDDDCPFRVLRIEVVPSADCTRIIRLDKNF